MTVKDLIKAWNSQADEFNQWNSLDSEEMVNFALKFEREQCALECERMINDILDYPAHDNGFDAAQVIRNRGKI